MLALIGHFVSEFFIHFPKLCLKAFCVHFWLTFCLHFAKCLRNLGMVTRPAWAESELYSDKKLKSLFVNLDAWPNLLKLCVCLFQIKAEKNIIDSDLTWSHPCPREQDIASQHGGAWLQRLQQMYDVMILAWWWIKRAVMSLWYS